MVAGAVIRTFTRKPAPAPKREEDAEEEGEDGGGDGGDAGQLELAQGLNTFVWDLRYPDAERFPGMVLWNRRLRGPRAVPGSYRARLTVGDWSATVPLEVRPDPLSSLFSGGLFRASGRAWGYGFGLAGFVATDPALTGIPMSAGTYSWGGAATTHFWVDRENELVGIVLTQLLPDGTYPVRQMMQQMTYQAIVD